MYLALRRKNLRELMAIGFDGIAIGGLSGGRAQARDAAHAASDAANAAGREAAHLMGVGTRKTWCTAWRTALICSTA